ncbi:glycosyltransferase family 4 protein [Nodosilinea sp. PGN35]|uniref:glycosyltransferase family 4 protein n=1 Tax=Nodosilinea sp. PGN35 TaxID=3020489 RepID=UPI0023B2CEBF|nr:glycosyltransferase family 4 protein [Nodosilinea sp. TSF1-S3]MDF0367314.1 glycosyltransferase family 4 protein [Nodosilinea sp. TSF1-S3]
MKILHLSTSDLDGGAAKAAYRIHRGLISNGLGSTMLVRHKLSSDPTVIANKTILAQVGSKVDGRPLKRYAQRERTMFSPQWFPDSVVGRVQALNPDVVHLHWTCNGFLQIESLAKFKKPIVWTLHDMWAFTGGCHYAKDCDGYTKGCGSCPQLGSNSAKDLSHNVWLRKAKAWRNLQLTVVTPSQWMAQCANASSLFSQSRVKVIANGIDGERYRPIRKAVAREALNLPKDKRLVLFGAGSTTGDQRKGFHHLLAALQRLQFDEWRDRLELVIFGESAGNSALPIPYKTHYLGRLNDDASIALAYASADVFLAPSLQDNLPNTIVESLMCGTPCVAFKVGGMVDMIDHQRTGYLVEPFDVENLAQGIAWTLGDDLRRSELSQQARVQALRKFDLFKQAEMYRLVYESSLN